MILKIMAVDDEPEMLQLIKAMAEPLGMEVSTAVDSREAAQLVKTEVFDGFVVDARMPHLDGFELTKCIRTSPANAGVPIAMLTGMDDVETMRQGFRAGITFFLSKPFSRDRASGLLSAMRAAMLRERRRHARLPYRTTVECRFGEHGERVFKVESLNLGEGGMLFEPSGGVDVGQEVSLEFSMPNCRKCLNAKARVLRREPPDRVAVEFIFIEPEDKEVIRDYIFGRAQQ
jgi:CheY-like chemotaxis protein